ncbi:MAG: hemolysin family protein, partial [Anaerolineae bacterium]|nr:hemolysin family protein [Anaerolineae bacterium]
LCSGTEAALFSVPPIRVRQLAETKTRATQALLTIRSNLSRPIASIVILNNVANIVGSIAVGSIATTVLGSQWLGLFSGILTFLVIIFSEIIPKTLGERYAETISLWAARPVLTITYILTPIVWLVERITSPITRGATTPTTNEAEIKLLARIGQQEGIIEEDESELIHRIFLMNDMTAEEMMTPRVAMTYFEADQTLKEIKAELIESPHSRIIVIGETIDDVLGFVLKSELLVALIEKKEDRPVRDYVRSVEFVPETTHADKLLDFFRQGRQQLAIVMDEFGGVAGIITIEDVLETLTGDLIDETDEHVDLREASRKRLLRKLKLERL